MGIPYSREINAAFEQVTPLVAAGFEVLQTTKDIAILLACIQVLTVVLLAFILLSLIGVIFTMNPDLEDERQQIVTPVMKWLAGWILSYGTVAKWLLRLFFAAVALAFGLFLWHGSIAGARVPNTEGDGEDGGDEKPPEEEAKEKAKEKGKKKKDEK